MHAANLRRSLIVASVLFSLGGPWPASAQEPIRVGASIGLTGSYAKPGAYSQQGYQLCQKQVNEQGGLLGRKIEFVFYDDRSDAQTAVRLYEKLITEDKVDVVMGPYASNITEAVANVTEKYQKLMVAPDTEKVRSDLLNLKTKTMFGDYQVDERGFQVGHKMVTIQWQDGKQVVVWPGDVAAAKPRFPTPAWNQR
jgi:branched-chain amino acid transport system substrate-binding protein